MTLEVALPFHGFCESIYTSMMDSGIESTIEYYCEENPDCKEWIEENGWGYQNLTNEKCFEISKSFCDTVADHLSIELQFVAMDSPREYNFATDRVFANIARSDIARLVRINRADDWHEFDQYLKDNFTSYDGFMSHYSNRRDTWGLVETWDHNQLGALLVCAGILEEGEDFVYNVNDSCAYDLSGNGELGIFDHDKFLDDMQKHREQVQFEEGLEWWELAIRCDKTPDLFNCL